MPNWITPACDHNLAKLIGGKFSAYERTHPNAFPDLRGDPALVLASDYSGDHQESQWQVLSFILTSLPGLLQRWDAPRALVREQHFMGDRRHAFKKLGDAVRQRALIPFLHASSVINGVVLCVAVHKSVHSHFGINFRNLDGLKPLVMAKLTRIAALGSILTSGLSKAGQEFHWTTDDDEIVANEKAQDIAGKVLAGAIQLFCPHGFQDSAFGIASKFEDGRCAEDLCAIPDLVGGAVVETLGALQGVIPESSHLFTPVLSVLPTKVQILSSWISSIATGRYPLKYMFAIIRDAGEGRLLFSFATPETEFNPPGYTNLWTPLDKGWRKALEAALV